MCILVNIFSYLILIPSPLAAFLGYLSHVQVPCLSSRTNQVIAMSCCIRPFPPYLLFYLSIYILQHGRKARFGSQTRSFYCLSRCCNRALPSLSDLSFLRIRFLRNFLFQKSIASAIYSLAESLHRPIFALFFAVCLLSFGGLIGSTSGHGSLVGLAGFLATFYDYPKYITGIMGSCHGRPIKILNLN